MPIFRNHEPDSEKARMMRLVSLGITIPFVLLASPFVGWALGWWVGGFFDQTRLGSLIGLGLGVAAGVRQTAKMVKRIIHESK